MTNIKWQEGTVSENGVNGLQVEDVLAETIKHVEELNTKFPCVENEITLSSLDAALRAQKHRTADRIKRGVESTMAE